MKKISGILLIFLSFALVFCFLTAPFGERDKNVSASDGENAVKVSTVTVKKTKEALEKYEVIMSGADIYVYKIEDGERELLKKAAAALPRKSDMERLEKGIETQSLEDALLIFEDFVS